VSPSRELRLDAVARYLQDVAADDVRDAGIEGERVWVVRRTELRASIRPGYGDDVDLVTWCAGTGAAWAERRTTLSGVWGVLEASSLWVSLSPGTMRPAPLDERFFAVYGEGARTRTVKARLRLPAEPTAGARSRAWPLRRADFDLLGHVNNAIAWAAVEQDALDDGDAVVAATVEYRAPIESGAGLDVRSADVEGGRLVWLIDATGRGVMPGDG
jgi:acyl-ACP thioesterase